MVYKVDGTVNLRTERIAARLVMPEHKQIPDLSLTLLVISRPYVSR